MHFESTRVVPALALAVTTLAGPSVSAQVSSVDFVTIDNSIAPELSGYITSDINIDFAGQWSGSQLLIELDTGSFYRDPLGAANGSAPSIRFLDDFIPISLSFDSYVIESPGGGAVDLGAEASADFPAAGGTRLSQAWNPAAGVEFVHETDFQTARITLSEDASGTWTYLASAGGEITVIEGTIADGVFVPEPTTAALAGLAGLALLARRRRA